MPGFLPQAPKRLFSRFPDHLLPAAAPRPVRVACGALTVRWPARRKVCSRSRLENWTATASSTPYGIAIAHGHIYVSDSSNDHVERFSVATATFERKWGTFGHAEGQLRNPLGLDILPGGRRYVVGAVAGSGGLSLIEGFNCDHISSEGGERWRQAPASNLRPKLCLELQADRLSEPAFERWETG
jgi:hypothetical protein